MCVCRINAWCSQTFVILGNDAKKYSNRKNINSPFMGPEGTLLSQTWLWQLYFKTGPFSWF